MRPECLKLCPVCPRLPRLPRLPFQVRSYSRSDAPGTLRRKDEKRKAEREERKARKAGERARKEEELRRLKNLKRSALESKLAEIARMSGLGDAAALALDAQDLDGDFDPDKFDAAMARAFGDDYYGKEDMQHPGTGGLLDDDEDDDDEDDEDEDEDGGLRKGKKAKKAKETKKAKKGVVDEKSLAAVADARKLLDEMASLEHDDMVDDTLTRFRYASVAAEDWGLSTAEILTADDKLLNSFVSLKKVAAPYRPADSSSGVSAKKRKRFREELKRQTSWAAGREALERDKQRRIGGTEEDHDEDDHEEEAHEEENLADGEAPSESAGKKKRKRRRGKDHKVEAKQAGGEDTASKKKVRRGGKAREAADVVAAVPVASSEAAGETAGEADGAEALARKAAKKAAKKLREKEQKAAKKSAAPSGLAHGGKVAAGRLTAYGL